MKADDLLVQEIESLAHFNEEIVELDELLRSFSPPQVTKGKGGEWFFHFDSENKKKKYYITLAECMDDRNAHNPLIILLSVLKYFGVVLEELDERMMKALEVFAPKILNKIACAGPFTLRNIPKDYYAKLSLRYNDAVILLPVTAHIECGAHGKNNLKAILRRLEIVDEIYDWNLPNVVPIPMISYTTGDHALAVLDSYDEVIDLVTHFADSEDDLEKLKTAFISVEHAIKRDEEVNREGKYITKLFSDIFENGNSSHISRFLELDRGNIQIHHTKYIRTNLENIGLSQYVVHPSLYLGDYQHFHLDVIDVLHEEDYDELLHEVDVALHYTNIDEDDQPTFWHINIRWDNPNKKEFLEKLREEILNTYNPFAKHVKSQIDEERLFILWNEFDKKNQLKKSEELVFEEEEGIHYLED